MLIAFYFSSLIILISTLGFGFLINKFLNLNLLNDNHGLNGILGLFILSIISSYSHLIVPHNYIHNFFLIVIGVIFFIIFKKKKSTPRKFNNYFYTHHNCNFTLKK